MTNTLSRCGFGFRVFPHDTFFHIIRCKPPPPQRRASPIHHPGDAPLPCIVTARGKHILNCFAYLSHSFINQNNGNTYTLYINYATSKQTLSKTPLSASYIYSCYRTQTMELHTLCTLTTQRVNKR